MPRIPSLVWAVPMTLALLVLAKGMLQSGAGPAERAAPGLVKRIEPPGRLHAPEDARPVSATPNPVALAPELERSDPPIVPTPQSVKPFVPQADVAAIAAPKSERPAPILYPVADDREVPRMASAFPRVDGAGPATERLPNALESRHASPAAHATAASPLSEQALSAIRHQVSAMNQSAVKLAQRGALYSARAELLEALRLVAQAHDAQRRRREPLQDDRLQAAGKLGDLEDGVRRRRRHDRDRQRDLQRHELPGQPDDVDKARWPGHEHEDGLLGPPHRRLPGEVAHAPRYGSTDGALAFDFSRCRITGTLA